MTWEHGGRIMVMVHCPRCSVSFGAQPLDVGLAYVCRGCGTAFRVLVDGSAVALPEPVRLTVTEEDHGRGEVAEGGGEHSGRATRRPKR